MPHPLDDLLDRLNIIADVAVDAALRADEAPSPLNLAGIGMDLRARFNDDDLPWAAFMAVRAVLAAARSRPPRSTLIEYALSAMIRRLTFRGAQRGNRPANASGQ